MSVELAAHVHDGVLLVACGREIPGEAAFAEFLETSAAGGFDTLWVHTAGGYYNAGQRRRAAEVIQRSRRIAIMVDATVARGAVTAFSWLVSGVRAFSGSAFAEAREYLNASVATEQALRHMVDASAVVPKSRWG